MLGAAVVAAALVFVSTRSPGPGLDPDSMAYAGAASSLAHRGTLRVPTAEWDRTDSTSSMSLWPPGFPAVIAVPVALGASPIQTARWINIIAAGVTAATVVFIVAVPLGTWAGLVAATTVFATQAIFDTHLSVLSEPLFIAVLMLLLAAMIYARDRLLVLTILATGAVMVRYVGASAPAAAVVWTWLDSRRHAASRVRRALVVSLLPFVAIVAWVARTAVATDRHATPAVNVYGGWGATLLQARDTLSEWLAPLLSDGTAQRVTAGIVALAVAGFIVTAAADTAGNRLRQLRVGGVASLLGATGLLAACYLAVVLASRAFVGGTIPLDSRILAPLIVLIEIATITAIGYWWRAYHFPVHAAIAVVGLLWIGASVTVTANDAIYAATVGSDFASDNWRHSPLIAWVRTHAVGHPIYSNWPPALYFHANRIARELPDGADPGDVAAFGELIRSNHGYVIGFDERSPDFMNPAELARRLGLQKIASTADGSVWAAAAQQGSDSVGAETTSAAREGSRPQR